jgi:shikimate 5-dehydrogenase
MLTVGAQYDLVVDQNGSARTGIATDACGTSTDWGFEMSFHPSLMVFLSVGLGGMAVAVLAAIVLERIDAALTPLQRTAGTHSLVKPNFAAQATSR